MSADIFRGRRGADVDVETIRENVRAYWRRYTGRPDANPFNEFFTSYDNDPARRVSIIRGTGGVIVTFDRGGNGSASVSIKNPGQESTSPISVSQTDIAGATDNLSPRSPLGRRTIRRVIGRLG